MKVIDQSVTLLACTENAAQLIEAAGRTCYKSEDKITEDSAEKFVKMIRKRGHVSVIEHASATFRIVTDRGITHEIVRHRLASYSQESTRYCNYGKEKFGKEISVVRPPGLLGTAAYEVWKTAMVSAELDYFRLLEAGAKPQIARSVLPTCLKTEIVMTANFREWSDSFLHLRLAPAAHPQIRVIAYWIWEALNERCPAVFSVNAEAAQVVKSELLGGTT